MSGDHGHCNKTPRADVLVVKLVGHHSCGADRLPVAVRFPAGPRVRLKTVDPPKGNGLRPKKTPRAGFEAGFDGLKAIEIGAKQHDKERPFF